MIRLHALTLIITKPHLPSILVMRPVEKSLPGKSRIVPIEIGTSEAKQIGIAIEHTHLPRPTTHDLFLDALTNLDTRVDHVLISNVKGQTFFAQLVLRQGDRLIKLDARPSDAIALAIRQDAPFYINEDVLEKASFPHIIRGSDVDVADMQEFRTFLENISPEDFEG